MITPRQVLGILSIPLLASGIVFISEIYAQEQSPGSTSVPVVSTQQPDPRDESTLDVAIQQDIGAYLAVMKQIPDAVATLNNDQHALVVRLRGKAKWWEDCAKSEACLSWVWPTQTKATGKK